MPLVPKILEDFFLRLVIVSNFVNPTIVCVLVFSFCSYLYLESIEMMILMDAVSPVFVVLPLFFHQRASSR